MDEAKGSSDKDSPSPSVSGATAALPTETASSEGELITFRGKQFAQTVGDEATRFGWRDAVKYYMPVLAVGVDTAAFAAMGEDYFGKNKASGYTPLKRVTRLLHAIFALLPLLDSYIVGDDWSNPTREEQHRHASKGTQLKYRMPLYLWTAIEILNTVTTLKAVTNPASKLTGGDKAALLLQLAILNGGLGITIAHELTHKQSLFEKVLGYALMCNVAYPHWIEEHLSGHHETVATPNDPATSREGETWWGFWPRTMVGGWLSSWRLEMKRLREEQGIETWATPQNRMLWWGVLPAVWSLALVKYTGSARAIPYFYAQGFGAASLLEIINYVEHYGLARARREDGTYEPVSPVHSWNTPARLSNTILWKLQRHSDHHTFASRPYEMLRNFRESPQLPCGYPGMVVLALFPPAYQSVMGDLLAAHKIEYSKDVVASEADLREAEAYRQKARVKYACFAVAFWWFSLKQMQRFQDVMTSLFG